MKSILLPIFAGLATTLGAHPREFRPARFADDDTTLHAAETERVGRVVLVHGFLETGSNFRMLRQRLQKRGFDCLVPRLRPCDGRGGLDLLAAVLKQDIEEHFGTEQPLSLVGFSMGGIVGRHYLQNLDGAERCRGFITISSPHQGTQAAWLYPTKGARQMRPGSDFLADLARTESQLGDMPVTSYRTPFDLIIVPAGNSHWQRAENLSFPVALHPLMLNSRKVLDDIERRLLAHSKP
ncbi:MAG TPA: alpha/beta fold hydrolase [Luteolibacter sp.]|nr:alpha/beta fold hydrolase [Luteolibacter sp.]